ncbi:histidine phosphatase superfamily [Phyllosticta paracitricarpa]
MTGSSFHSPLRATYQTGPFAGTLGAFTTGVRLRTRYSHLLPPASSDKKTNFWAGDSDRVIDTARYFAAGFFGLDWQDHAQLHIIPETEELGADTLTPGDTCIAYINDAVNGHDKGARMLQNIAPLISSTSASAFWPRIPTFSSAMPSFIPCKNCVASRRLFAAQSLV